MRQLLQEVGVRRIAKCPHRQWYCSNRFITGYPAEPGEVEKNNVSSQVCRAYLSNYMELHPNLQVLTRCKLKPHVAKKMFGVFRQQQNSNVESVKHDSQRT